MISMTLITEKEVSTIILKDRLKSSSHSIYIYRYVQAINEIANFD